MRAVPGKLTQAEHQVVGAVIPVQSEYFID